MCMVDVFMINNAEENAKLVIELVCKVYLSEIRVGPPHLTGIDHINRNRPVLLS